MLRGGHLAPDQSRVEAAASEELAVATGFNNVAPIQHCQEIGVAHRRQPMRDDDRRAVAQCWIGATLLKPVATASSSLAAASTRD